MSRHDPTPYSAAFAAINTSVTARYNQAIQAQCTSTAAAPRRDNSYVGSASMPHVLSPTHYTDGDDDVFAPNLNHPPRNFTLPHHASALSSPLSSNPCHPMPSITPLEDEHSAFIRHLTSASPASLASESDILLEPWMTASFASIVAVHRAGVAAQQKRGLGGGDGQRAEWRLGSIVRGEATEQTEQTIPRGRMRKWFGRLLN